MKVVDIISIAGILNISADYLLGTDVREEQVTELIKKLSTSNREIVMSILKTMVCTMKS